MLTKYVAGAMFNEDLTEVALIRKNRPDWQAGKLNMIGGHVELNEMFITTMVREFEEETGVKTSKARWRKFHILEGPTSYVVCYCTIGDLHTLRTTTDEVVELHKVADLPAQTIVPNLSFLIPAAIYNLQNR